MVFMPLVVLATLMAFGRVAQAGDGCAPAGGWSFICGPAAAEDLVRVPGTSWIVGSGMSEAGKPGRLHLIDSDKKTWGTLYPNAAARHDLDAKTYAGCPGAPDANVFGAHGIAIRDDGKKTSTLLAVNHGREAIEVFKIDAQGAKPNIAWIGCVLMGKKVFVNSVAFLPGGGFVATQFYDPSAPEGFGAIASHKLTGGVLEWHPATGVQALAGTELTGANGIEVSKDGKWLYVAAWGTQELVRFSRGEKILKKDVIKVDFSPDNLRWAPDGQILVAGQNGYISTAGGVDAFKGWTVAKLDPATLKVSAVAKDAGVLPLQNVSVGIDVEGTLWVGPFRGDRVAYKALH
jgi:hypothetical protein